MRIAVTGGTGFIGSVVVRLALARGHDVTALVREPDDARLAPHDRLVRRPWDLADAANVGDALDGVDALLHLAAFIPPRHDDAAFADPCFRLNASASRALVERAATAGVAHAVFASTGGLYTPGTEPSRESDGMRPPTRAPYYLTSKFAGEAFVATECARRELGLTIVRIASPYGSGMRAGSVVARFVEAARRGATLDVFDGDHTADFVYVDDVAVGILAAAERRAPGTFNLGSGVATSMRRLAETVRAMSESSCEIAEHGSPVRRTGFAALDVQRAAEVLGWHPTELRDGLRTMLRNAVVS